MTSLRTHHVPYVVIGPVARVEYAKGIAWWDRDPPRHLEDRRERKKGERVGRHIDQRTERSIGWLVPL